MCSNEDPLRSSDNECLTLAYLVTCANETNVAVKKPLKAIATAYMAGIPMEKTLQPDAGVVNMAITEQALQPPHEEEGECKSRRGRFIA